MIKRLDPHDRVKELGDASVPFHFDIHAIIYSEKPLNWNMRYIKNQGEAYKSNKL